MIRKLKAKFIFANMLSITVVLSAALCIIYFLTARNLERESMETMKLLSERSGSLLDNFFSLNFRNDILITPEMQHDIRQNGMFRSYFTIYVYEDDGTYQVDGFDTAEEDRSHYINSIIQRVYTQDEDSGLLSEYALRYFSIPTPRGKKIVLLDKTYEDTTLHNLLLLLLSVGSASFILMLLASYLISRLTVKTVENSLLQQKQLISDISHELKTPIAVIGASADVVRSHPHSIVEEQDKFLNYIYSETKRMSSLISDLLLLARSNEYQEQSAHPIMNLSDLAYSVSLPFESICFEKDRELVINIEPNLYIRAKEGAIKQLISILLDNACKYSNEKGIIFFRVTTESDKVLLSVRNTGIPIPPEKLPMIFDRFYRIDESRSRSEGGHGLGLAIAKKITEENNGKIHAESSTGYGTVFTCVFRRLKNLPEHIDTRHS